MLKALCVIGVKDYPSAHKMMVASLELLKTYKAAQRGSVDFKAALSVYADDYRLKADAQNAASDGGDVAVRPALTRSGSRKVKQFLSGHELCLLLRCEWILCYHSALCAYHTGKHSKALQVSDSAHRLTHCLIDLPND